MYPTWLESARARGEVHTILIGTQVVRLTDGELDALRTALGAYQGGPAAEVPAHCPDPVEHTRPPAVVAPQLHPAGVARFADPAGYEAGLR